MLSFALATVMFTVTVNDRPVRSDTPPVSTRDRILLPARAIFTALGAAVAYERNSQRITVRRAQRSIVLRVGSRTASIDGRTVRLDAPPRLYRGRTYVPVRFIAESLGATVDFDSRTRVIAVIDASAPLDGAISAVNSPAQTAAPARSAGPVTYALPTVERKRPIPGENVASAFPTIGALLTTHGGPAIDFGSVRFFVDGHDVTDRTFRSGDEIAYSPPQQLFTGRHTVTIQGQDRGGNAFSANWSFDSAFAYSTVPSSATALYVNGPFVYSYGNALRLVLIAPAGGAGYVSLCRWGAQYPFQYGYGNRYESIIALPPNQVISSCSISGYFYDALGNRTRIALDRPIRIDTTTPWSAALPATPSARRTYGPPGFMRATPTPPPAGYLRATPPTATPLPTPAPATRKPARKPTPKPSESADERPQRRVL